MTFLKAKNKNNSLTVQFFWIWIWIWIRIRIRILGKYYGSGSGKMMRILWIRIRNTAF